MAKLKSKFIIGGGGFYGMLGISTEEKDKRMTANSMPGNIITDDYDGYRLLIFTNSVLTGKNDKDEYWTNGYTAKVVEQDGKKMIKIFFRLTDDYEPYYIDPREFKELIEIWIKEKAEFDKGPTKYKEELKKRGGEVIEE